MANEPYSLMTDAGMAWEASALLSGAGVTVSEVAFGQGVYEPNGSETGLVNEVVRAQVVASGPGSTPNVAFFRVEFDAASGPYSDIAEAGLFASDGTMIAIAKYPEPWSKPTGFALAFDFVVAFTNLDQLNLSISAVTSLVPSARLLDTGVGLSGGGDLSADRTFSLDFANQAEAIAGVSEVTVMSPARTKDAIDDRVTRLVGAAPADLDTLAELAEAIGNDDDFFATMMKRTRPRRARRAYFGGR